MARVQHEEQRRVNPSGLTSALGAVVPVPELAAPRGIHFDELHNCCVGKNH
jgi:hypothetical protein